MVVGLLALGGCFVVAYLLVAALIASAAREERSLVRSVLFGLGWPYMVYLRIKNSR
jgi:hypothetical protein